MEITRKIEGASSSWSGPIQDENGLDGIGASGVFGGQPPVMGTVDFGPQVDSRVVTFPVWVGNFPHWDLIENPRCGCGAPSKIKNGVRACSMQSGRIIVILSFVLTATPVDEACWASWTRLWTPVVGGRLFSAHFVL